MESKKFITNLKCSGCVAAIQQPMDAEASFSEWSVDLQSEDKVLTVVGEKVDSELVTSIFAGKGYEATEKKKIFKNIFG